ncbi:type II secretion system F family protein [Gemmata sp. JC717]|uniref:type II secretion system F family protein n=1 Tax=Gemmata algarum TaxID=2975278 RepID=UPI0021BA4E4D|nr:type II secretion system F family protein [Gemmata algarum]MDY3555406.1 type II secretion system F family protein [Gemmata algarum]
MLFSSSKCPLPALVEWCRVLRFSLSAGLDPLKIFKQQAKSGPRPLRALAGDLAKKLAKGSSLEDALEPHRDKFPPLFVELIAVGEQTGRLDDTFQELEQYFAAALTTQRRFRAQMAYPVINYVAAVGIVTALIFILGMLGSKMDPTGLGLTGTTGALAFLGCAVAFAGSILAVLKIATENLQFRARLEGLFLNVPGWGPALLAFALLRFAVSLRMCAEAGLRAEKTLHYCFRATCNTRFQQGEERAVAVVKRGRELVEALEASRAPFPRDFIGALITGEETGNTSEVMDRLAEHLREEADRKMKAAAQITGYMIYGMVALMIIFFIFRIATAISGVYSEALGGM